MKEYDFIVIGASAAGVAAVQSIRNLDLDATIALINGEDSDPYKTPKLSKMLKIPLEKGDFVFMSSADLAALNIDVFNTRITKVDSTKQLLSSRDGAEFTYQQLILATGVSYVIPSQLRSARSITLQDKTDVMQLQELAKEAQHISILGAGVLGLELANEYYKSHQLAIIEKRGQLLGRNGLRFQERITQKLAASNIDLHMNTEISKLEEFSDHLVLGLAGEATQSLRTDLLVVCTGTHLDLDFLESIAGIQLDTRLIVDANLQVTDNIYACGNLVRLANKHIACLWHEAEFMGRAAGANAVYNNNGQNLKAYEDRTYRTKCSFFDEFFYFATPHPSPSSVEIQCRDYGDKHFELHFLKDKFIGCEFNGINDSDFGKKIQKMIWESPSRARVIQDLDGYILSLEEH